MFKILNLTQIFITVYFFLPVFQQQVFQMTFNQEETLTSSPVYSININADYKEFSKVLSRNDNTTSNNS